MTHRLPDGKCTQQNAVPAQAKCNSGLCVASLSIDPLTLVESGCVAHTSEPPPPHVSSFGPPWKTAALACQLNCASACESGQKVCVPEGNAAPPPDFATCVYTQGEEQCPEEYPERHVFYKDYTDTRACTTCSCDPPAGGACAASLSVYQGSACQGAPVFDGYPITAKGSPFCVDLAPGLALGSKAMTAPTYLPGACTPHGGELTGSIVEVGPSTFCCLQS